MSTSVVEPRANVSSWLAPISARSAGLLPVSTWSESVVALAPGAASSSPLKLKSWPLPWPGPATAPETTAAQRTAATAKAIVRRLVIGLLLLEITSPVLPPGDEESVGATSGAGKTTSSECKIGPRGRVVHPAPGDHRGDQPGGRVFERVAVEDDEVRSVSR